VKWFDPLKVFWPAVGDKAGARVMKVAKTSIVAVKLAQPHLFASSFCRLAT
jgi:hypothetical protein